ncbi:alpha/beta hydrolase family protein [Actinacidiphila paucisporea]|uniref:Prolyl oligopeptidase family protein n=1 Tax=Actinacidiphila paucisporea TaxID=310782 RepID=A0A1M7QJJ4_9ACTN|nr:alpha/beta hydrolase [Actinacidiphila paucisporea]SHN31347.1 Prolyl oligopeptidase family protein [Actinacidiphila paucisporea]
MAADSAAPPPVSQAEAEEASAFRHAPVPADATAAYGDHQDQLVDFFRPRPPRGRDAHPAPLVALLHGGAWRAPYDRTHVSPLAAYLAGHGYAVASVEYRKGAAADDGAAAGRWPDTFDDVAAAVDALPALAVEALGADLVDPRRVVLTGHSAGGQLALWAAARHVLPPESRWHRTSAPPLRGVVALAPIADFTSAMRMRVCSDAVIELLGGPDHLTARLPQTDPAALLPTGIPVTIVHGTTDIDVPPQVSHAFARAAAAAGEEVVTAWLPATGHFPLIDPSAPAVSVVADEIAQLAW